MKSAFLPQNYWSLLLKTFFLLLACLFNFNAAHAEDAFDGHRDFPVLYKGRIRPAEAYARLWLYEVYHSAALKKEDLAAFKTSSPSPLDFLWSLELKGFSPFENAPFFWIGPSDLKKKLGFDSNRSRFSYKELRPLEEAFRETNGKKSQVVEESTLKKEEAALLASLSPFQKLTSPIPPTERAFRARLAELELKGEDPKKIERTLEREFPLAQRLARAGELFKSLPSRYRQGEWLPLKALKIQVYQAASQGLRNPNNFTLFSDDHFEAIRTSFEALENAAAQNNSESYQMAKKRLGASLFVAYRSLEGFVFQEAHGKRLNYPTLNQLKTETQYASHPWIPFLIFLYAAAVCLLFAAASCQMNRTLYFIAFATFLSAVLLHTALLAARTYILERPPVSNMFETVLYVPWVAVCAALFFPKLRRQPLALMAACSVSIILLTILEVTDLNQSLSPVQAVLDSQFWLLIHVLAVVGSYGLYILGAVLGHFYLIRYLKQRKETPEMLRTGAMILQTLYGGTALLVGGTILGGIWAAESWGRFWDWDPKESWAFISICLYLIWIHAFRFGKIGFFGLSIGAVSGLLAISFTWYGVNYILGAGLHSYGFGSGGEFFYYSFLAAECAFLGAALSIRSLEVYSSKRNTD